MVFLYINLRKDTLCSCCQKRENVKTTRERSECLINEDQIIIILNTAGVWGRTDSPYFAKTARARS